MRDVTTAITSLEAALANPISRNFKIAEVPDVLAQLLGDKRSATCCTINNWVNLGIVV